MPRKLRDLVKDLLGAGFHQLPDITLTTVNLDGKRNDDAHHYQEKQVRAAIAESRKGGQT